MPSILFIHENFPAQFGGIAGFLAKCGWKVVYATAAENVEEKAEAQQLIPGVDVFRYSRARDASDSIHPYLKPSEFAVLNAQGFARLGAALAKAGFAPDVIVAHSGWGSGSLARIVWPGAKFVQYLEWWYHSREDGRTGIPWIRQQVPENHAAETLCRNLPFLLDLQSAEAILVPTAFQAEQIPKIYRPMVHVIHDGVDDEYFRPAEPDDPTFTLKALPDQARIITYATRGMEPMRGFPQFMKAWAQLQHEWPDVHCVVAGRDRVSYSPKLKNNGSYKDEALAKHEFDRSRLHFCGHLPRGKYRALLQRSAAHVYLTYPFVLSWSLIEAMMTGAPIIASATAPVLEAAPQRTVNYVEVDDTDSIATGMSQLLSDPELALQKSQAARAHAQQTYSAQKLWPMLEDLFLSLFEDKEPARTRLERRVEAKGAFIK